MNKKTLFGATRIKLVQNAMQVKDVNTENKELHWTLHRKEVMFAKMETIREIRAS